MVTASIYKKGAGIVAYIPAEIRDFLGIKQGDRIEFIKKNNVIQIKKA